MRRAAILTAFLLALAVPAVALASGKFFQGSAAGGVGHVEFRAIFKHGKPRKIKKFEYQNIPVPASTGCSSTATTDKFGATIKVNHKRKFNASHTVTISPGHTRTATITGKFKSRKKVTGKLRVKGVVVGGGLACDTGAVAFKAHS
jgi:hypothetical protein